jgi:hypothetical protein
MRIIETKNDTISLNSQEVDVATVLYLDATMDKTRGTEIDINRRLG